MKICCVILYLSILSANIAFSEEPATAGQAVKADTAAVLTASDDSLYVPDSLFTYAGDPRYTLFGHNPLKKTDIKLVPSLIMGGTVGVLFYLQHVGQMNTIWEQTAEFHVYEDGKYALYADKAGHFFGCYFTSYLFNEGFTAIGMNQDLSVILGATFGLAYSTYVEILDGYGINWGFCPSDWYADIAGAAFFVGQRYVPFLQNFTPKFTYVPANWHDNRKRVPNDMFIDDYSSHTLWLSANVHNMLPDGWKKYWPDWLQLSFGYAARNLCDPYNPKCKDYKDTKLHVFDDGSSQYGNREFIVALDYNLVNLLPDGCNLWNWFKQSLNHIKFPAPAYVVGDKKPKFYLFYPLRINLTIY